MYHCVIFKLQLPKTKRNSVLIPLSFGIDFKGERVKFLLTAGLSMQVNYRQLLFPFIFVLLFIQKSIVYTYYNHSTSEFPELCVDSNSKGGLNKFICTSAVRSRNSRTRMKTCWNEFIAICLYFAYQLNQTPQIFSNMRKIFKLFVLCPFSTCNS